MSADLDDSLTDMKPADMAFCTHRGHVRSRNEDSGLVDAHHGLCLIADGVGGQGDGLWAGKRTLELVADALLKVPLTQAHDVAQREKLVLAALIEANEIMAAENAGRAGSASGTTIAGLWAPMRDGWTTIFNIGDSPIFHLAKGDLQKISRDHSLFQMWIDGGRLGKEPSKRMIMQAVGISERLAPHILSFTTQPGDSVLMCTDGLSGALDRELFCTSLRSAESSQDACERLLAAALAGPAADNITVSVCRF